MEALACQALQKAGDALQSVIIDRVMTYLSDVKNYEQNMISLCEILEKLCVERKDFDDKVKSGKVKLEILTYKAVHWLGEVQDFTKHKEMKKLMINDMGIARAMLRLMKDADLKMLVEEDGEMHELVLKVMKDYAKRRKACNGEVCNGEVLLAADEQKDKEVGQVLEKLMEETLDEVKALMQNDMYLAVAALHLLENHMVNFERLTEKDKEMADVITKAREMSLKEEWLSRDNHLSVLVHENNLREKVTNLLKPMEEVILNEELLKAFPENLSLGMEAMGFIIGNSRGQKAELIKADNTSNHRTCCVISYSFFSDRHDMSVAAKDMLNVANTIIGRKPGDQDLTRPMRKEEMLSMPTNFIGLKSINELLVRIVGALASSDVLAVGVIGMGGSGKTTLAKEIVRSKANGIFDKTVMVVLTSQSPNMEWIQDQIANGLELPLHNVHGTPEKATHIYNKLRLGEKSEGGKDDNNSKKTLIVLVNIWKEIDLLQIGIPRDCKLLLTSGEREVCKAMNVQDANIFEVGLLSDDEAKNLFKFQIQKELTGEYNSVADKLLEKCRGLPLSIVTTANFVKGKELRLWKQYADELDKPIPCQMTGVHHEAFSILRTSYEAMASKEKKSFFLLACLSPVGSNISIDNLMRYGIGLDLFQHVNKLSEAINRARIWAEELLSSSMIQKGDSNEYVKIHDVVREFIISFASNGLNTDGQMFLVDAIPRWICEETFNKYTGISLLAQVNFARLSGVKADLLQILLFKGNENHSSFLESNFFQGMTNLKVLEMLFMNFEKGLPESIGKLKVLKTLHLVDCKLGDIKLIGELGSLLVLSLRGSTLEALPDEIGKLYKLRLLDMSKCQCKEPRISANVIARLPLLEGLYLVDSSFMEWAVMDGTSNDTGVSNGADIEDLTKLDFLNMLEIHMRGLIYLPICDQFVKNLDKFQIIVGQEGFKLQPCQRGLMVSEVDVSQELKKDNCLKALLKKADFLALKMTTVKNIVPELDKEGYRDLTRLELSNISSISRVCEGKAPTQLFLNLRHLEVSQLANLKELLPLNPLPHNLTTLDVRSCNALTYIFGENGGSLLSKKDDGINKESNIIELHGLKKLNLRDDGSLISMVPESSTDDSQHPSFFNSKVKLPSLEELYLNNNKSIVKMWGKESKMHSFKNLKILQIICCQNMETIGPPSMFLSLLQLESLDIRNCQKMQQVISQESEKQEIREEIITFPKLKILRIWTSFNLKCFYGGSYQMKFPCLEAMDLESLYGMKTFAGCGSSTSFFDKQSEFPCLEELQLELSKQVTELWDLDVLMASKNPLHKLRKLSVKKIKLSSIVFHSLSRLVVEPVNDAKGVLFSSSENEGCVGAYSQFPKLEELVVVRCPGSIEQFVEVDDSRAMLKFCGQLSNLRLNFGLNMKVISLHLFKSLRDLTIYSMKWEYLFSANGSFELWQSLEELNIYECTNLEVIIRGGDRENVVDFPLLKILRMTNLTRMSKLCSIPDIPFHFESLELIYISRCNRLETICLGPFVAPSLRTLYVGYCHELESLFCGEPNQVVEFPSLEKMTINYCNAMKSCSTRPLKAPKLRKLTISGCPKMEWFLLGNANCGAELELPSLEDVTIAKCPNMKSFSPAILRAPKLQLVTVDDKPYPIAELKK